MSKIKPFWRIVIGVCIFFNAVFCSSNMAFGGSFFGFAFWWAALAAYIFLCIKIPYDDPVRSMRDLMARQAEDEKARRDRLAEAERSTAAKGRDAWAEKYAPLVTNIAGVTFDNDDGSSRQQILREILEKGEGDAEVTLDEFYYKGVQAVRVLVDGRCIGNIPKHRVQDVREILDRIISADLHVETFEPDDADPDRPRLIYRADLCLKYEK